jgi:hypothetical protein
MIDDFGKALIIAILLARKALCSECSKIFVVAMIMGHLGIEERSTK